MTAHLFMSLILQTEPSCKLLSRSFIDGENKYWPPIVCLQDGYFVIYIGKCLVMPFRNLTIQMSIGIFGRATGNNSWIILCTMKVVFNLFVKILLLLLLLL